MGSHFKQSNFSLRTYNQTTDEWGVSKTIINFIRVSMIIWGLKAAIDRYGRLYFTKEGMKTSSNSRDSEKRKSME